MADAKITALNALATPAAADLVAVVDDVAGTPQTKKVTLANLAVGLRAASTTQTGVIECATGAETNTGTDATRAVTPDALEDWTGSAQVTTLGTIATGTWEGTDIAVADGGTGSSTAAAARAALEAADLIGVASSTKVDDYTAVLGDAGTMIYYNKGTAVTGTIPANASVAYAVDTELHFCQLGAGALTIAITSDTLNVESSLTLVLSGQYAVATAKKITATTWVLFGNLTAS